MHAPLIAHICSRSTCVCQLLHKCTMPCHVLIYCHFNGCTTQYACNVMTTSIIGRTAIIWLAYIHYIDVCHLMLHKYEGRFLKYMERNKTWTRKLQYFLCFSLVPPLNKSKINCFFVNLPCIYF